MVGIYNCSSSSYILEYRNFCDIFADFKCVKLKDVFRVLHTFEPRCSRHLDHVLLNNSSQLPKTLN